MPEPHRFGTARHEAGHVIAALMFGRRVEEVEVVVGALDSRYGRTRMEVECSLEDVIIRLVGYLSEGVALAAWPPAYEDALEEELEALGTLLRALGVPREAYDLLRDAAIRLADDPAFRRQVGLVASALDSCPLLTGAQVEELLAS
jgi:hypothetical protein